MKQNWSIHTEEILVLVQEVVTLIAGAKWGVCSASFISVAIIKI